METMVGWNAGGGSLNKGNGDNGLVERRGGSLNKEVEWRPWFSGTQGGKFK